MGLQLQVDRGEVIPEQGLEGKLAWVAKITRVFPCDSQGREVQETVHNAEFVRVQISNKSAFGGSSGWIFSKPDYERFQRAYRVNDSDDLMGKPVISVYQKPGPMLMGLIPLDMDG